MVDAPNHEDALALYASGQYQACADLCERQLQVAPHNAQVWGRLGLARQALGQWRSAQVAFLAACAHEPASAEFQHNLGLVYARMGDIERACADYERAHSLGLHHALLFNNWGCALRDGAHVSAALRVFAQGLAHASAESPAILARLHTNLGTTLCVAGQAPKGLEHLRLAKGLAQQLPEVHANWLLAALYSEETVPSQHADHARVFGRALAMQTGTRAMAPRHKDPHGSLNVGVLSPDLRQHPVATFLEPLLAARSDPSLRFVAYADVANPDATSLRLRGRFDGWHNTFGMNDDLLLGQLSSDGIDVLLDLSGHTSGARTALLCGRAAFVQVNYLGYPATTGLANMDFRIVDALTDPEGSETLCSETLLLMPHGFLCYPRPAGDWPQPTAVPTSFAFACFNNPAKISNACLRTWSLILQQAPQAQLVCKAKVFADPDVVIDFAARAASFGVPPDRLRCSPPQASHAAHLAAYSDMSVALDTFPYHGTTTTCEALAAGVPVVSLIGHSHVQRVGFSLLSRVGLADLACSSEAAYVQKAVALANDPSQLLDARQRLTDAWPHSSITNASLQAHAFEQLLRQAWQQRLRAS